MKTFETTVTWKARSTEALSTITNHESKIVFEWRNRRGDSENPSKFWMPTSLSYDHRPPVIPRMLFDGCDDKVDVNHQRRCVVRTDLKVIEWVSEKATHNGGVYVDADYGDAREFHENDGWCKYKCNNRLANYHNAREQDVMAELLSVPWFCGVSNAWVFGIYEETSMCGDHTKEHFYAAKVVPEKQDNNAVLLKIEKTYGD